MYGRSRTRITTWTACCSLVLGFLVPIATHAAGSAVFSLTGPGKVSVGQVFSIKVRLDPKGEDIDTVRVNGTYPKDQLRWIGVTLGNDFPSLSPNTYYDEGSGRFSIGAFRIGTGMRKATSFATISFRARAKGDVNIVLDSSSLAISAGENRLSSALSFQISVGGQAVQKLAAEQPATLPTKSQVNENPSLASLLRVSSPTNPNPDVWYRSRIVTISWESAGAAITENAFSMDDSAEGTPTALVEGQTVTQTLIRDGIWFAHVKASYADGTSQIAHLRVQVDATPPRRPIPTADQNLVPPSVPNVIRYGTTDDASGVDRYRIQLAGRTIEVTDTSYPLPQFDPGIHVVTVTAIDRAGNESTNDVSIEIVSTPVQPIESTWWTVFGSQPVAFFAALVVLLIVLTWVFIAHRRKGKYSN